MTLYSSIRSVNKQITSTGYEPIEKRGKFNCPVRHFNSRLSCCVLVEVGCTSMSAVQLNYAPQWQRKIITHQYGTERRIVGDTCAGCNNQHYHFRKGVKLYHKNRHDTVVRRRTRTTFHLQPILHLHPS